MIFADAPKYAPKKRWLYLQELKLLRSNTDNRLERSTSQE